ncbi:MAG: hypothetical protein U9O06_08955 [Euryarchaeota archaeon]|nr:hypothetical protein [Euryarchaeota archaeon]
MDGNIDPKQDSVSVSMEISGPYDDVVSKLKPEHERTQGLSPLISDLEVVLDTLIRIDGGTRSVIADNVSAETSAEFDAQTVVETMQILKRYDLAVLEGNTWKPGPKIRNQD